MAGHITQRLVAQVQVTRRNHRVVVPRPAVKRAVQQVVARPAQNPVQGQAARPSGNKVTVARAREIQEQPRSRTIISKTLRNVRQIVQKQTKQSKPKIRFSSDGLAGKNDLEKLRNVRGIGRSRILVIVGNGPSVSEVDLAQLANHKKIDIMSVNKPDPRVWPSRYWVFCDLSQFRRNRALWESYNGTLFNSTAIAQSRPNTIRIVNNGGKGFGRNLLSGYHIGRSSVYAAMQIALWLDYDQIYIVGCDMCAVDGKLHFYGVNPDVSVEERSRRFDSEAEWYDFAAEALPPEERQRFVFCSSYLNRPFTEKFNKIDHKVAVETILATVAKWEQPNG